MPKKSIESGLSRESGQEMIGNEENVSRDTERSEGIAPEENEDLLMQNLEYNIKSSDTLHNLVSRLDSARYEKLIGKDTIEEVRNVLIDVHSAVIKSKLSGLSITPFESLLNGEESPLNNITEEYGLKDKVYALVMKEILGRNKETKN